MRNSAQAKVRSRFPILSSSALPQTATYPEFVAVDGITGESTDSNHAGQIDVTGFAFGAQATSGGTPTFDTLQLTSVVGAHSADLISDTSAGVHLANLTLQVTQASNTANVVYQVQLSDVVIASYEVADATETWSVQYGAVTTTYQSFNSDGSSGGTVKGGYDPGTGKTDIAFNAATPLTVTPNAVTSDVTTSTSGLRPLAGETTVPDPSNSADPVEVSLEGINGDSTLAGYSGFIDADALGFGLGINPATGSVEFENVRLSLPLGAESPILLQDLGSGKLIPSATIDVLDTSNNSYIPLSLSLTNVQVADVQVVGTREVVELSYGSVSATTQSNSGAVPGHYDPGSNKPDVAGISPDESATAAAVADLPVLSVGALPQTSSNPEFVAVDGITGESTDSNHAGQIDVTGFAFGAQATSGGTPTFDTLQLTSVVGAHSADLISDTSAGVHLANLTLQVTQASNTANVVYQVQLSDVVVASYEVADTTETWTVQYGAVTTTYQSFNSDGSSGGTVKGGYDPGTGKTDIAFNAATPLTVTPNAVTSDVTTSTSGLRPLAGETTVPDPSNSADPVEVSLEGINGDSTLAGYSGFIDADALGFGLGINPATGSVEFENVRLSLPLGAESPILLQDLGSGKLIPSATVDVLDASDNSYIPLSLSLTNVQVADVQVVGTREVVELSFGGVAVRTGAMLNSATITGTVTGGQAGQTVYLDANNNSILDNGELSTTLLANGNYTFTNVPAGTYIIRQILASGFVQLTPAMNYGVHVSVTSGQTLSGENFADQQVTTISGTVSGGPAAGGETIYLDANNNSTVDPGELSTTTVAGGNYTLANVPAGTYVIRQLLPAGYEQVTPANNAGNQVTVTAGTPITGQNFADQQVITISGTVSGGRAAGGETIYLDANNNSTLDPGELSTTTVAGGNYTFNKVPAGTYIIRQLLPSGFIQLTPTMNYGVHVSVTTGQTLTGQNFTDQQVATISGTVSGGPAPGGETIYLDANNNSTLDAGELTTTTAAGGNYSFTNVPAGAYTIRQVLPSKYTQTLPSNNGGDHVVVSAGQTLSGENFTDTLVPPVTLLSGVQIGTSGSYQNQGNTLAKAFDGNLNTFFDAPGPSGDWVGLDLKTAKVASTVSFAPRSGYAYRMIGGMFQASNTANFSSGVATLATLTAAPTTGTLTILSLNNTTAYRYYRYLSPNGGYGNIAELEFFG